MTLNFLTAAAENYALSSAYNFEVPDFGTAPKVDIHDTLFDILEMFLGFFKYCFEFLKGFEFLGTNLLSWTVTLMVLAAVFPIIFSLVNGRAVSAGSRAASEVRARSKSRSKNTSD